MTKKRQQAKKKLVSKPLLTPSSNWFKPMLTISVVAISMLGFAWLGQWFKNPQQWPLQVVSIESEFRYLPRATLETHIAPLLEDGFFQINVGLIQQQVQQLPWVERVSIRRVWPDQLEVQVNEQQPVAWWGEGGLLNARAEVFEPHQAPALKGIPHLSGPDGYEQRVLVMYQRLQQMLRPLQLGVMMLEVDDRRAWRMTLSNGLQIEMGRSTPADRVARFVSVYPAILATGKGTVGVVDLRYGNGFALSWKPKQQNDNSTG